MYMPIITNSPWAKFTIFTTPWATVTSIGGVMLYLYQRGASVFLGEHGREIGVLPLHADRMGIDVLALGTEFHAPTGAHRGIALRDVESGNGVTHFLRIG